MSLESTLWTPNLHSHVSATEIASMRLVYLCRFEDFFLPLLPMLQSSTVVCTNSCAFWKKSLWVWHLNHHHHHHRSSSWFLLFLAQGPKCPILNQVSGARFSSSLICESSTLAEVRTKSQSNNFYRFLSIIFLSSLDEKAMKRQTTDWNISTKITDFLLTLLSLTASSYIYNFFNPGKYIYQTSWCPKLLMDMTWAISRTKVKTPPAVA